MEAAPAPVGCDVVVVDEAPFAVVEVVPDELVDEVVDDPDVVVVDVDEPDALVVEVDPPDVERVVDVAVEPGVVDVVVTGRVVVVVVVAAAGTNPGIRPFGLLVVMIVVLELVGG